jgi:RNA polymerase sigma-70 factor (ECF subfamily)
MRSISEDQFRSWSHGLQNSDDKLFAELFDAAYDALFRYTMYIVHDRSAAADIIQDLFLKLWQIRTDIDPERSLRALMYQMARNFALNHERQKKRHASEEVDADHPSVRFDILADEKLDADVLQVKIRGWIDMMPTRRREAFILSRYTGLSHDEIATLMNLAPKTVNNHIVLALQHLRAQLQDFNDQDFIVGDDI